MKRRFVFIYNMTLLAASVSLSYELCNDKARSTNKKFKLITLILALILIKLVKFS